MKEVTQEEWDEFCRTHFVDCPYWVNCDGVCTHENGEICNIWQLNKDEEIRMEFKIISAIALLEKNGYTVKKDENN